MKNLYREVLKTSLLALALSFGFGAGVYGQQYCTPSYSSGCSLGDNLNDVVLHGATVSLVNQNSGCGGSGYTDNTSMSAPDLAAGLAHTLSVGTSYSSPQYESVKVWIDYDGNNVFDPGEEIGSVSGLNSGLNDITFTVPASTTLGIKRMRVRLVYTQNATLIDPCSSETYGETEDYEVEIIASPSCLPPTALTVSNVSGTTLDLGWTENGTANEWQIEYGSHGFAQGSGT